MSGRHASRRIIPAYAGSTLRGSQNRFSWSDHPRIRGEHPVLVPSSTQSVGSSPHTRGARDGGGAVGDGVRIIPAYAGSTAPRKSISPSSKDHPRIRGEHAVRRHEGWTVVGSSPHTRGALRRILWTDKRWLDHPRIRGEHSDSASTTSDSSRIIPAYAGSTAGDGGGDEGGGDHPRIRGEHETTLAESDAGAGSSPHTRGAHQRAPVCALDQGIIPAYAGSTETMTPAGGVAVDHPRIRGEHADGALTQMSIGGSSPHTRGAPPGHAHRDSARRIIPAYAGSTRPTRSAPPPNRDHPRIRGEHLEANVNKTITQGSSPHTRGAPTVK